MRLPQLLQGFLLVVSVPKVGIVHQVLHFRQPAPKGRSTITQGAPHNKIALHAPLATTVRVVTYPILRDCVQQDIIVLAVPPFRLNLSLPRVTTL